MDTSKSPNQIALSTSLLTALTLAVGLGLAFVGLMVLFENVFSHFSETTQSLIGIPLLFGLLILVGGLWGWGLTKLYGGEPKEIAKKAGITFSIVVVVVALLLEALFAGVITPALSRLTVPTHVLFTMIFVTASGLIAGFFVGRAAKWLGKPDMAVKLGRNSGIAAALGFFVVNMIMLSLGWEVGGPNAAARFTMIRVMLTSNVGAALAGGWVFGKGLVSSDQ